MNKHNELYYLLGGEEMAMKRFWLAVDKFSASDMFKRQPLVLSSAPGPGVNLMEIRANPNFLPQVSTFAGRYPSQAVIEIMALAAGVVLIDRLAAGPPS